MAQSNNTPNTPANGVAVESKSTTPKTAVANTHRVFETQADWARLEAQTIALVVALAKGEALTENALKGFAFGTTEVMKRTDKADPKSKALTTTKVPTKAKDGSSLSAKDTYPHAQDYVLELVLGFASPKGGKALKGSALADLDREAVAMGVYKAMFPKGTAESFAKRRNRGVDGQPLTPKRGKWMAEQVLAAFSNPIGVEADATPVEAQPTEEAANPVGVKPEANGKSTPKGGKGKKKAQAK